MRHRFSKVTAYITLVALVLGNLVVATNAGDACGTDWPKCNGNFIPDFTDYRVLVEYSHRLFTGLLGFIILISSILAWKRKYIGETAVKVLSLLSLFLLLLQSLVGGANVLLGTPPGFTTIDATVSLILLASIVSLTTALERTKVEPTPEKLEINHRYRQLFKVTFCAFILFFLEIIVGAFFKQSGASMLVINEIPDEILINSATFSNIIYSIHGIANTIILLSAAYAMFWSIKKNVLTKHAVTFFILIVMNGIVGFLTQSSGLNVFFSSLHMIIAMITVFQGTYFITKLYVGPYFFKKT